MENVKRFMEELNRMKEAAYKVEGGGLYAEALNDAIKTAQRLLPQAHVSKSLLTCKNCGDWYGININHQCFKCLKPLW